MLGTARLADFARVSPLALGLAVCAIGVGGCTSIESPGLMADGADARIRGMQTYSQADPQVSTECMLAALRSPDPAVRLFAASELERATGHAEAYRPLADDAAREAGVRAWEGWYAARKSPRAQNAASPPRSNADAERISRSDVLSVDTPSSSAANGPGSEGGSRSARQP